MAHHCLVAPLIRGVTGAALLLYLHFKWVAGMTSLCDFPPGKTLKVSVPQLRVCLSHNFNRLQINRAKRNHIKPLRLQQWPLEVQSAVMLSSQGSACHVTQSAPPGWKAKIKSFSLAFPSEPNPYLLVSVSKVCKPTGELRLPQCCIFRAINSCFLRTTLTAWAGIGGLEVKGLCFIF